MQRCALWVPLSASFLPRQDLSSLAWRLLSFSNHCKHKWSHFCHFLERFFHSQPFCVRAMPCFVRIPSFFIWFAKKYRSPPFWCKHGNSQIVPLFSLRSRSLKMSPSVSNQPKAANNLDNCSAFMSDRLLICSTRPHCCRCIRQAIRYFRWFPPNC